MQAVTLRTGFTLHHSTACPEYAKMSSDMPPITVATGMVNQRPLVGHDMMQQGWCLGTNLCTDAGGACTGIASQQENPLMKMSEPHYYAHGK